MGTEHGPAICLPSPAPANVFRERPAEGLHAPFPHPGPPASPLPCERSCGEALSGSDGGLHPRLKAETQLAPGWRHGFSPGRRCCKGGCWDPRVPEAPRERAPQRRQALLPLGPPHSRQQCPRGGPSSSPHRGPPLSHSLVLPSPSHNSLTELSFTHRPVHHCV